MKKKIKISKKRIERFGWKPGEVKYSQCLYCIHNKPYALCAAFPEGIPKKILENKVIHDHSIKGDHGIQFEIIPGFESEYKELVERLKKKE